MSIEARFKLNKGAFSLDVDLSISSTAVTSIMGPSGCGKTTLLRLIAGLEQIEEGYLRIGDEVWQDENSFCPPHLRKTGYVFQEASLFTHLNVKDNVRYGLKRRDKVEQLLSLGAVVELMQISHLLDRSTKNLSGGEKQRVAIARALASSPDVLLMDEPLTALDDEAKRLIMPILSSLQGELRIPVIYVSHSTDEVARLADDLILMESGKVKGQGKIDEVLTRFDLPLAHANDAETLIEAMVTGHDNEYALTYLHFAGGEFTVPGTSLNVGDEVRIRILARDVSLTLQQQKETSILNIFPVEVDEITALNETQLTVRLLAAGTPLLSRITRKSAVLLNLKRGSTLFAQAKSVALLA